MTRSRPARAFAALLGLSVPALLIAAVWMWEWRMVATAAIVGLTAPFVATQPKRGPGSVPWPRREEL